MKIFIALITTVLFSQTSLAEIYRWVDEAGNTIYSDKRHKDAEKVELPGISSYASKPVSKTANNNQNNAEEQARYSQFKISEPGNDATVRDNAGRVVVLLELTPALLKGDTVVFDIDGKTYKQKVPQILFSGIDRGTHILKAYIIDGQGKAVTPVVSSQFHMKRASILNRSKAP